MKGQISSVFKEFERSASVGRAAYSREAIYRWLYENSDSRGIIIYKQWEVANLLDIAVTTMRTIYQDFVKIEYLIKRGPWQYEVVYDPDELDWGEDFIKKQSAIRKRHQLKHYNHQEGEYNE